jgi:flagellar protein FlbT
MRQQKDPAAVPLVVHLRKGQQVIVNGAVLENNSPRGISFAVQNEAAVLRSDDILTPAGAVTPASRVYYALQCAYLFRELRDEHLRGFIDLLDGYVRAAPSAAAITAAILASVEAQDLYTALKSARLLIEHERKVLSHVESRLAEELHDGPAAGRQSAPDGSLGAHTGGVADEGQPGNG